MLCIFGAAFVLFDRRRFHLDVTVLFVLVGLFWLVPVGDDDDDLSTAVAETIFPAGRKSWKLLRFEGALMWLTPGVGIGALGLIRIGSSSAGTFV